MYHDHFRYRIETERITDVEPINCGEGKSDMYINVVTMMENMKYKEELLVTTPNFVGGVGGSFGLFLGFSCYGVFSYMVEKFFDLIFTKTY